MAATAPSACTRSANIRSGSAATELSNPDFAALARAFGGWAATVETTEEFAPALDEALKRKGIRLLHCKTDVEQITNATTIAKLREKAKAR